MWAENNSDGKAATFTFNPPGRQLPKSIFIAGGGPVGVEFAPVFAGLGVLTTISDSSDRLIHTMDAEMSKLVTEHLKRIGVDVILGSITRDIRRGDVDERKITPS
jgi:glutathione reductase (NADPH)